MKTRFLFPHVYKKAGWILLAAGLLLHLLISYVKPQWDSFFTMKVFAIVDDGLNSNSNYFSFIENSVADELYLTLIIVGGILVGFSRLKEEDEFISKIRYESLVWATYFNYALVIFFTLFLYGMTYLNVLFYNMFTLLLFFIIRFHYRIYKLNKTTADDQ